MRRRTCAQAAVPVSPLSLPLAGCAGTAGTSTVTAAGGGSEKAQGPIRNFSANVELGASRFSQRTARPRPRTCRTSLSAPSLTLSTFTRRFT
jgi:hypothetical protein